MARLERHGDDLLLILDWRERFDLYQSEVRFAAALVREVEVTDDILASVHGLHDRGRGRSTHYAFGVYVTLSGVKRLAVVHEDTPRGLILRLTASEFDEILFGCANPYALKDKLGLE